MLEQTIQVFGAILLLAAFGALQLGYTNPHGRGYLLVNTIGSAILALVAIHGREWGFILLEGSWTVISLVGLLRQVQRPAAAPGN